MSDINDHHVTAVFAKPAACPNCQDAVSVIIELDRSVVALTTILSGFYEAPRDFDIEACIDEGLDELAKRTHVHLERRSPQ